MYLILNTKEDYVATVFDDKDVEGGKTHMGKFIEISSLGGNLISSPPITGNILKFSLRSLSETNLT